MPIKTKLEKRTEAIVQEMVRTVPLLLSRAASRNCCILSTRVGLNLLEHYSIAATPVALSARALNKAAIKNAERINSGRMTVEEMARAGVRYIEIDTHSQNEGYAGHLALRLGNAILDLNSGQFWRDDLAAPPAGMFHASQRFWDEYIWTSYQLPCGGLLSYIRLENPPPYETSGDWHKKVNWFATVRDMKLRIDTLLHTLDADT